MVVHIAYIVQGGSIISIATNNFSGTSSVISKHTRTHSTCHTSCHAEIGAIKKIKFCNRNKILNKKTTLYSIAYRIEHDSNGTIISCSLYNGKPCRDCAIQIVLHNFNNICYSTSDSIKTIKLKHEDSMKDFIQSSIYSSGRTININLNEYYSLITPEFINCINQHKIIVLPYIDLIKRIKMSAIIINYVMNDANDVNIDKKQYLNGQIKHIKRYDSLNLITNHTNKNEIDYLFIKLHIKKNKNYLVIYLN